MRHGFKKHILQVGLETLHFSGLSRMPGLAQPGIGLILTLHHVSDAAADAFAPNRGLAITPAFLDEAIKGIRAHGYEFVSLDEVHRRLTTGSGGRPFAAITLDDGYRDNRDVALPVFETNEVPFTVFVTTGFAEGTALLWWEVVERILRDQSTVTFDFGEGTKTVTTATIGQKYAVWDTFRHWVTMTHPVEVTEKVAELSESFGLDPLSLTRALVLTRDEIVDLARHPLATIGAHTLTHPNLMRLPPSDALHEMRAGADLLRSWLGARPRFFAYPYGFKAAACRVQFELARQAGFDLAVTTRPGVLFPDHGGHLTALPRVSLNGDFQAMRHVDVLMSGTPFFLKNRFRRLDVA